MVWICFIRYIKKYALVVKDLICDEVVEIGQLNYSNIAAVK